MKLTNTHLGQIRARVSQNSSLPSDTKLLLEHSEALAKENADLWEFCNWAKTEAKKLQDEKLSVNDEIFLDDLIDKDLRRGDRVIKIDLSDCTCDSLSVSRPHREGCPVKPRIEGVK